MSEVSGNDKLEWLLCSENKSYEADNDDGGGVKLDDIDDDDVDEDGLVDENWHSSDGL